MGEKEERNNYYVPSFPLVRLRPTGRGGVRRAAAAAAAAMISGPYVAATYPPPLHLFLFSFPFSFFGK